MKRNASSLAALLSLALATMGAGPGSCGTDPEPCEGLDEQSCLQTEGCEPVYFQPQCACSPCPAGMECPACSCGSPEFASCSAERPEPPPAERCAGLNEAACVVEPGCAPTYFASEPGVRCESDRCIGDYAGCVEALQPAQCESLDEAACLARPDCEATYDRDVALPCVGEASADGSAPRCGGGFSGCHTVVVCPAVMCDLYCPAGYAVDARGCSTCSCNQGCTSDAECAAGERCELPLYDCGPEYDCGVAIGRCVPEQQFCSGDFECAAGEKCVVPQIDCPPGAYCAQGIGTCMPACASLDQVACSARSDCQAVWGSGCSELGCTPDLAFRCEDAAPVCPELLCDVWCENGFVLDAQGCPTCACRPVGCYSDADCAAGEICEIPEACPPGALGCDIGGVCRPAGCFDDSGCPGGMVCLSMPSEPCPDGAACESWGFCAPVGSCLGDADCAAGESCIFLMVGCLGDGCGPSFGTCSRVEPGCASDADCAPGQVCEAMASCTAIGCPPPGPAVCVDRSCTSDADCADGSVCRADPSDPCSSGEALCFTLSRLICQAPCAGLDEAACLARSDCSAAYVQGGGWCGNDMVFDACADR